jgi:drug/metabolite transporter (DMT)-like permease
MDRINWWPATIVLYVFFSAFRDVYLGGAFQTFSYFEVVLLTAFLCTIYFAAVVTLRQPGQWTRLRRHWRDALWVNLATAAAWLSFFHSLQSIEPSIAGTLYVGVGPFAVIFLRAMRIHISAPAPVGAAEKWLNGGILISLLLLAGVEFAGLSGLKAPGAGAAESLLNLALAFLGGVFLSLYNLVCKRMNENGVSPEAIISVRFVVIASVSGAVILAGAARETGPHSYGSLAFVSLILVLLIAAPNYLYQVGISRTPPLTTNVIRATGPMLVFIIQIFEGRVLYSRYTLACIALYSGFVVLSNLGRSWKEAPGLA